MTRRAPAAPDLAVVISANGLGHARRCLGVLARLLDRRPGLEVVLVAEAVALGRFDDWPVGRAVLDTVTVLDGVVAPGVTWSTDPSIYDDGRLVAWEERLASVPELLDAAAVLSDNLVGTLSVRPDAVLMGSFLASDVLDHAYGGRSSVDRFVEHERELLERLRPPMLCVGPIAMPGVLRRTDAVALPWMCESVGAAPAPAPARPAGPVAVLGGRTGAADELLADVAAALVHAGLEVRSPAGWPDTSGFDHSPASYESCAAVVARPGLGTIHDCIGAGVPMVLAYESGNVELTHNATCLDRLGFGRDAGADPATGTVVALVAEVLEPVWRAQAGARMAAADRDGLAAAAAWLDERIVNT